MASCDDIHQNDIGTIFEITLEDCAQAIDISSATLMEILIKKPSGTNVTKSSANISPDDVRFTNTGVDGKLECESASGDLDEIGSYYIQARVTLPTGKWSSTRTKFKVSSNLDS